MVSKPYFCVTLLKCLAAMALSGCGGNSQWEITVENQGTTPCSVYVMMDYRGGGAQGTSEAKVQAVAVGEKLSLMVGDATRTIRSIKVERGDEEQVLKPNAELTPGRCYQIVVAADGNVETSFVNGK